ncbi:MAG: aminotransferase class V-fold PLP-dependent enzyme [Chlorobi bacterium]|nr:aminotransferase class V-fold PLP-dependent enzyme [Chlorobiota bacterium]
MENKADPVCLRTYFGRFRRHITGIDARIPTPYGEKPLVYLDWTASGRLYRPIEHKISEDFGRYLANTHTDTSFTGQFMTRAYHEAVRRIKQHVKADDSFAVIQAGYGMTGAVNKLQRILGLRVHERYRNTVLRSLEKRPVVFVSRMEHHSNHISWLETLAEVVLIPFDDNGMPSAAAFEELAGRYEGRPRYLSLTACSNVTGLEPDLERFVRIAHRHGFPAFVDYACSAPYADIDLSGDPQGVPDAIMFSPHKFLGGPGTGGLLIMRKSLYGNRIPDEPGGGTVAWTDPWDGAVYLDDIEARETGGTPGFLQMIKSALAMDLKERMDPALMRRREHELLDRLFDGLEDIPGVEVLEKDKRRRLGVVSVLTPAIPYTGVVRLLNDLAGIQTRGGCSCAGTYGHYLLGLDRERSQALKKQVLDGHPECKPGWTRISIHPTTTEEEVDLVLDTMARIMKEGRSLLEKDYRQINGQFVHKDFDYSTFIDRRIKSLLYGAD